MSNPPANGLDPESLVFLPLGGAGEIGMNLSLYGFRGRWLMVDMGVAFADEAAPGVDLLVPDIAFIEERRARLDGIVITHAHEDHIGAVPLLWSRLRCPIYATPFTSALLRRKLAETVDLDDVPLRPVRPDNPFKVGPFQIEYVRMTHSIPEAHVLAIRTALGTVAHATDWKLDPAPIVGPVSDEAGLERVGDEGILAVMCDSTNVFVPGSSGSEADLRDSLIELIGKCRNRVALACFASNVARLHTIAVAAQRTGRRAALVGRALWRVYEAARETGYLDDVPPFLTEYDIGFLPRDQVVMCVTGSQGEPRSALARIAAGDHPQVDLEPEDTVVFSSRVIPGNEKAIGRVQNDLSRRGIHIVTENDHFVHVSGHPARAELARMYQWLRPRALVPIHGEARHLYEHVSFARECGIAHALVAENGSIVRLAPGEPEVVDRVRSGRLAFDGSRLVPMDGAALKARRRMRVTGVAIASVVLDGKGRLLAAPKLSVPGVIEGDIDDSLQTDVVEAIEAAVEGLSKADLRDDAAVAEAARLALRRAIQDATGKKPLTEVQVVRLD
jgi:ribonuclease J